jgi:hypothetical protein
MLDPDSLNSEPQHRLKDNKFYFFWSLRFAFSKRGNSRCAELVRLVCMRPSIKWRSFLIHFSFQARKLPFWVGTGTIFR